MLLTSYTQDLNSSQFFSRTEQFTNYCVPCVFHKQADNLQKSLKLFHAPQIKYSEGGIPIGPSTQAPSLQLHALSTPRAHLDIPSEPAGLYVHILFALKDRDLGSILGNFAYWIHGVFVFLEANWELMVCDLEKGEINPDLDISPEIRRWERTAHWRLHRRRSSFKDKRKLWSMYPKIIKKFN